MYAGETYIYIPLGRFVASPLPWVGGVVAAESRPDRKALNTVRAGAFLPWSEWGRQGMDVSNKY